ncbi:MAG: hypothetical protein JSU67_03380, partial [Gammaproteobacteria bacterium]
MEAAEFVQGFTFDADGSDFPAMLIDDLYQPPGSAIRNVNIFLAVYRYGTDLVKQLFAVFFWIYRFEKQSVMRNHLDAVVSPVGNVVLAVARKHVARGLKCGVSRSVAPNRKQFFAVMRKRVQAVLFQYRHRLPANVNSPGFLDLLGKPADLAAVSRQYGNTLVVGPDA